LLLEAELSAFAQMHQFAVGKAKEFSRHLAIYPFRPSCRLGFHKVNFSMLMLKTPRGKQTFDYYFESSQRITITMTIQTHAGKPSFFSFGPAVMKLGG